MQTPRYIADFDSASAMLRALANFLRGEEFPGLGITLPRGRGGRWLPGPLAPSWIGRGGVFR